MLTPEYLQGLPDELVKLYEELEHELIDDICRRLKKAENITDTAVYQTIILEELGASEAYIKEKISKCSDQSEELCEKLIRSAAKTLSESYGATYAAAQKEFTPYEKNEYLQQLVSAQIEQTDGELRNMTNSLGFSYRGGNGQIGFHSAAETYRDCLDTAYTAVLTGAMDYITAVRTATKKLTDSGLKTIDYASGVSTSADVAVRRALLTGIHQTTAKVAEHNMRELNTDIVEVSAHSDSRPSHAEWQGKWYSFSGTSEDYPSLREVTKYGEPSGLLGPNCRHSFHPVIVGVDEPSYTDEELEKMKNPDTYFTDADGKTYTLYEAEQRKRYMERKIRATKKELLAAQETGDTDKFTAKSVLLKRQKAEYERFCQASKQLVENERTQYTGFGKSISQKAVWAAKKAETAKAKRSSSKSSASGESSSGHSVEVDVPAGEVLGNTEKIYMDTAVHKLSAKNTIDNSKNGDIIEIDETSYDKRVSNSVKKMVGEERRKAEEVFGSISTIRSVGVLENKSNDWGSFNDNSGELLLRYANKKNYRSLVGTKAAEMKKSGEWSTGVPEHIVRHEIGHAIQLELKKNDSRWSEKYNKLRRLWLESDSSNTLPSVYSSESVDEFISECIAEYLKSPSKSSETAKSTIIKILLGDDE